MPAADIAWSIDSGRMNFRTGTGLGLLRGVSSLDTSRGSSTPTPDGVPNRNIAHRFHAKLHGTTAVEFWQSVRNVGSDPLDITKLTMFEIGRAHV